MSYQSKFADDLRKIMQEKKISQATVARLTSLDQGTISRVLSCKKAISFESISTIAYKLNMWKGKTPCELVKYIEELEFKLNFEKEKFNSAINFLMISISINIIGLLICLMN